MPLFVVGSSIRQYYWSLCSECVDI